MKQIKKLLPKSMQKKLAEWLWPIIRRCPEPLIQIRTYYPGCYVKITTPNHQWNVEVTNDDPDKIPTALIENIYSDLLRDRVQSQANLKSGFRFDFSRDSVSLESWRDIHEGRIQKLIDDDNDDYESERVGAFGFLLGTTKPERLKFIEMAKEFPIKFEFIETHKYSPGMKNFLSLLDYKRKFKYVIDLPGHTYSTKSYWMLFLKRPMFYVEPNQKFDWEKKLKPWKHYIPVKRDFSDLVERYDWAQSNPEKVHELTANLFDFGMNRMSPENVHENFIQLVRKCLSKNQRERAQ